MRWLVAGLFFALAVVLAIGTAAIRADNVRARREIEREYRAIQDRIVELQRLQVLQVEAMAPERLAEVHWRLLGRAAARRSGGGL